MHQEQQYLDLLNRILEQGEKRGDRTGEGTQALFGTRMSFDLRKEFPLFTTKKMAWKSIVEELLWFIRGNTNSKDLEDKGVKIWRGNSTRDFLDKRGLKYPEGFIGPGYGWQWRSWGKRYAVTEEQLDYGEVDRYRHGYFEKGKKVLDVNSQEPQPITHPDDVGIDQLAQVIETIKTNPTDRRMIVSAWNVAEIAYMALPPCHLLFQFFVNQAEGTLSCQMYQRSCDMFLGVPFNVASYSLLTILIAKITGYQPGDFIWIGGDSHVYIPHVEQVLVQVNREPYPLPTIEIPNLQTLEDLENLTLDDIKLNDYQSHERLVGRMAV